MEITDTVVYLKTRSPTTAVATTPHELWHGVKPNLSHLKILGSTAYVHIPKEKRIKLDIHSHKGIMIGYGGTNQYKVWDLTRKDVVVSRDVVFIEGKPVDQTPAVYIEEPRIMYDSITVLPGPPETKEPKQQLPTPPATENADSDSEEPGPDMVDPQILLQESTANESQESISGSVSGSARTSARSNKGTITSKKNSQTRTSIKHHKFAWQRLRGTSIPTTRTNRKQSKKPSTIPHAGSSGRKPFKTKSTLISRTTPGISSHEVVTNKFAF